jgi:hypothetical protein
MTDETQGLKVEGEAPAGTAPVEQAAQPQQQEATPQPQEAPVVDYTIEGIDRSDPVASEYEKYVKQLGLSPEQATSLYKWASERSQQLKTNQTGEQDIESLNKKGMAELQKMWGQTVDQNLRAAQNVFRKLPPDVADYIDRSGLGSNPAIVRAFYELSKNLEDRSIQKGEISGVDNAQSAKQKLADIMNDKNHPYHSRKAAGHTDAVEYVQSLYRIIYGG